MRKKQQVIDIITQKQEELKELQAESNDALDIVTSTIEQLSTVNEKIEIAIDEIETAKADLQSTEDDLNTTKNHNSKIISKFKALIEE